MKCKIFNKENLSCFPKYINDALNYSREQDKAMCISGWNYPIDASDLLGTVFLRGTSCWGWATWTRAWQYFEKILKHYLRLLQNRTGTNLIMMARLTCGLKLPEI
ncbi:MAG: hypothetical protein ACJAVA_001923 [Flavobacteriaceae bacterium]|jgi:hypothetical protein